jgi:VIT1/CCC1 family predicted Fe2+/Mn2+ transporter
MKRRSFLLALLWTCWIPFALAVVAVVFQSLRITGRTTQYYALGKILAGVKSPGVSGDPRSDRNVANVSESQDFYGTVIEMLESSALRARALERVRALHPELKEIDVLTRVTQTKGSAILNVAAVGEEPKYTRIYLDALLDEYIAFRKEMIDKSVGTALLKVIEQVLTSEKRLKTANSELQQYERANDPALLSAEHDRRVKEVSGLRGELEALKRSGPDEVKMKALMDHLASAEKSREEIWEKTSKHLELQKELETAKKEYHDWKAKLELVEPSHSAGETVAIMERPNAAVEQEPELWMPLVLAVGAGFAVGVVLMIVIATLVAAFRRPDPMSPPLG